MNFWVLWYGPQSHLGMHGPMTAAELNGLLERDFKGATRLLTPPAFKFGAPVEERTEHTYYVLQDVPQGLIETLLAWARARRRHESVKNDPHLNGESGKVAYDAFNALAACADRMMG